MKAVLIYEYGGPEKLTYADHVPEPTLRADSVLIESAAASVNPIDWKIRSGARQKDFPQSLPAILGVDLSGVVRAVGADVKNFKSGDRVLAFAAATYAQSVAVESSLVTHLPEGLDLVDASAIPLVALTGDQLVRQAAGLQSGQTVLVSGALGSVGRAAVHAAAKLGARVVAGVRKRQLEEARSLNTASVVAIDDDEAIVNLDLMDAVVDTVGGETAAKLISKVKQGGRFGYASALPQDAAAKFPAVRITRVFAHPDAAKVRQFAEDVRDGKFVLPIGHRLGLSDAAQAHRLGENGGAGKIVLVVR